ncbi:hypothetical protein COT87_02090 [Candidatus Collierbacteria bacterium CG10_big_fil_rev_8_21_14_0_10_44_9]|uniref:DUF4012 domain-containing protein n=1 Tax=Candidatus Collierbacteria bacterium CG10_big_fil_rev_8_21_14_0_10_44_9 TaxID=1974535 RepID=A0A2H0VKR7_9BACT|nr:MAG: hypothetical protein COT87_02090 [Candidatus Collierbacteria bacterium CG10_big_fil_rev_8_21_14_0_10_44_9]
MGQKKYTVETRELSVILFAGPNILASKLIQLFLSSGIYSIQTDNLSELAGIRKNHDLDYLVIFEDHLTPGQEEILQSLINSGETQLILIKHLDSSHKITNLKSVSKIIIYSDYLCEDELGSATLSTWLEEIISSQNITLPGDGLAELSLLGIDDLTSLISKIIIRPNGRGEKYLVGNPEPTSLLNLAYLIRTNIPFKINLKFGKKPQGNTPTFEPASFLKTLNNLNYQLLEDTTGILIKYLKTHISNPIPTKKLTPLKSPQPIFVPLQLHKTRKLINFKLKLFKHDQVLNYKKTPHPSLKISTIIIRGLAIAIALYLGTLAFSTTIVSLSLKNVFNKLQVGEIPPSSRFNNLVLTYLRANWFAVTSFPSLNSNQFVIDTNQLLDAYNQSIFTFKIAESLNKSIGDLTSYLYGSDNIDIAQTISLARLQAEELYQNLSLLDGSLPHDPPSIILSTHRDQYVVIKTKLSSLKHDLATKRALLAGMPELIGLGGRRKYALLFQNNMELRSTGGFIGSFAIITLENGKLYDMPVFDVYEVDGQLKGHVEPPKPIKDILGESNWYLRDSNFDPDFPTTASRVQWFIKKSMNIDLDGVIALNINSLSNILKATGPIDVRDYSENVTETNLVERSQFHAEGNFFPGSTQKKEFFSSVASAIFLRLSSMSIDERNSFTKALGNSIEDKNTLISLTSPSLERIFKTLGWNGNLTDLPCPTDSACYKDYVMVVDNNFGINKVNYFIKRSLEEIITINNNLSVNHVIRLNYTNTSTSSSWPSGIYKNYQRLYLPIGTTISDIKINGKQLDSKDYTISLEHDKQVLAYLVSVPVGGKVLVEVSYNTQQLQRGGELTYSLYWQKQSGTSSADLLTIYLNYPPYLLPTIVSPQSEISSNQLKFNLTNDTDHRITVKFSK